MLKSKQLMITSVVAGCLGLSMVSAAYTEEITLNMAVPDWIKYPTV